MDTEMMRKYIMMKLSVVIAVLFISVAAHAERFQVEGSDMGMGVGARQISMAGAAAGMTDDVYSLYWNPAGLASLEENQIAIAGQINARLDSFNFLGVALGEHKFNIGSVEITPGYAYVRRLSFDIDGTFGANDLETVFLEYVLPGIPSGFSGHVQSTTEDHRLVFGIKPRRHSRWRFGFSVAKLRCVTNFCGVTSNDPNNYIVANVLGKDITFNVGAQYEWDDLTTVGFTFRDVDTELVIDTGILDNSGFVQNRFKKEFLKDFTLGVYRRHSKNVNLTADFQMIFGSYGTSDIDFKMLRFGYEKQNHAFTHRFGMIVPITIESNITSSIKDDLPFSLFAVTTGAGWEKSWGTIDLAAYAHPMMSYGKQKFYPAMDLSVMHEF